MSFYLYAIDDEMCAGTLTDYADALRHAHYGDAAVSGPWTVTIGDAGLPRITAAEVAHESSDWDDYRTIVLRCGDDQGVCRIDLRA